MDTYDDTQESIIAREDSDMDSVDGEEAQNDYIDRLRHALKVYYDGGLCARAIWINHPEFVTKEHWNTLNEFIKGAIDHAIANLISFQDAWRLLNDQGAEEERAYIDEVMPILLEDREYIDADGRYIETVRNSEEMDEVMSRSQREQGYHWHLQGENSVLFQWGLDSNSGHALTRFTRRMRRVSRHPAHLP